MKRKILFAISILLLAAAMSNHSAQSISQKELNGLMKNLPFKMTPIKLWSYPNKNFEITKYGAVGDGFVSNTKAIQKAIDDCSKSGGGKVIVPAGMWLTGPITLKDNVNLHLDIGAHIQFSRNFDEYDLIKTVYEGTNQYRCTSPLNALNAKNIAVTGEGIIDGGGDAWRLVKKSKLTDNQWNELVRSGGVVTQKGDEWWPSKEAMEGSAYIKELLKKNPNPTKEDFLKVKVFLRPVMVSFIGCKNVYLEGVTFQNSPAWNIHPLMCQNLILYNVNVRNPWYSQNGDGIDVESCKNFIVYKCKFDVGDDAICMKSGKDEEGRKRGIPTENGVIQDCIVYHGHGGFTVGSEMSGGIRNLKVSNCNFIGTDIGLRFKSQRGRGGVVENIYIDNIFMQDIPTDALSFNMYYNYSGPTEDKSADEKAKDAIAFPINDGTPIFRKIYMKDIYCNGAKDAIVLQGLPEMNISEIEIENVNMKALRGISMYDAEKIKIKNAKIASSEPLIKINRGMNVLIENFEPVGTYKQILKLDGANTKEIILAGKNASEIETMTQFGNGVQKNILKVNRVYVNED